jgi:hypothetical protein
MNSRHGWASEPVWTFWKTTLLPLPALDPRIVQSIDQSQNRLRSLSLYLKHIKNVFLKFIASYVPSVIVKIPPKYHKSNKSFSLYTFKVKLHFNVNISIYKLLKEIICNTSGPNQSTVRPRQWSNNAAMKITLAMLLLRVSKWLRT